MGRKPREISESKTYHVIMRGVAKNNIFTCEGDKDKFKQVMFRYCEELKIGLISYILMDNHVHLEVCETADKSCSDLVKKICISYVQHYFNKKYDRCGALFQPRYNSRAINTNQDILNVSKYIHQNALVQGIPEPFKYSSYGDIIDAYDKKCCIKAIFATPIQKMMSKRHFKDMVKKCDKTMLMQEDYTLSDDLVKEYICRALNIESVGLLHKTDRVLRDLVIKTLAENGINMNRLARITCLTKPELRKICYNIG